ncbi:type II secretion system F family protein [Bacterioplanoides pacificum]|uniref:Type II secretion system F family protein n=1 Tax=Bacterioplanoides pacificum TaxID=1171596 RepID=A0ABV7VND3_9GAMM
MDFLYRGRDASGNKVDGTISAMNSNAAQISLEQRGIVVVGLEQTQVQATPENKQWSLFRQRINAEERILLTRQLYALTKAGIPILRALNGLMESGNNASLKTVLRGISDSLVAGSDLSTAFRQYPEVFSPIYISMIHIGETTGKLDDALLKLIAHLEMERETRKRIKAALRYPLMVISAISVAMVVITLFVIPSFTSVFNKLGADLPVATQILIAVSDFMQHWWHLLAAVLAATFLGLRQYIKTDNGALWWDRKKLKIPLIGSIFERIALSRFSRSFAMMMAAGVPVLQCLAVVSDSVGNRFIGRAVNGMLSGVERGDRLTNTASATGLFTPLVLQMLAVGEETGAVDKLLDDVADFYDQEVDYELKQLADAIEPLLLAFLGALVLVLALGVFLPIWELGSAIR